MHGAGGSDRGLQLLGVDPKRHETLPPPRFTEASLVKPLEEDGIGRPSTYALDHRHYRTARLRLPAGQGAGPELHRVRGDRAAASTTSADYVDVGFTAEMEEDLDADLQWRADWLEFLARFYRGDGKHAGLEGTVGAAEETSTIRSSISGTDPETGAADTRPHRALRPVRAARRRRSRQHRVDSGRLRRPPISRSSRRSNC